MRSGFLLLALLGAAGPASGQRFLPDDPVAVDPDDLPIAKPGFVELATVWDALEHTFMHRPSARIPPAQNVSTLGEVPDSSWFQNRIGAREMTLQELVRGPVRGPGPDLERPLSVIRGKSQGITPGFTVRDARGDVYFVKPDPKDHPNLSTAADVIGSKFFHAFGYLVPENHIAYLRREQLEVAEDAKISVRGGGRRKMTEADLDHILRNAYRRPDGRVRMVASLRLPGEDLGPHKFWGSRTDDPNDRVPHEHRRELRGYRLFCAWLNHDDSRSVNTKDVFVRTDGERGHVKHYLIDFSSTLGVGSDAQRNVGPQNPRSGNEYVFEFGPFFRTAATLGIWERPWRKLKYREFPEIGRIEADFFDAEAWKPEYPNPAFERMRPADAFWAARIISRFSDEAVRAIVHTGQYDDPVAERHLADTLLERRDKVVAHYFAALNPVAEFRISGGTEAPVLEWDNLGEGAGLATAEAYEVQWHVLDNLTGGLDPVGPAAETARPASALPPGGHSYLMARIRTRASGRPGWRKAVEVFIRKEEMRIVGIEREE